MDWDPPPKNFSLAVTGLHLWKVKLPLADSFEKNLEVLLNVEERARAARFYFPRDRHRFTQFRGLLRYLLGQYRGESPQEIRFNENPQGKPGILPTKERPTIYFNLAHSEDVGLFAFTRMGDIGVDVERLKDPYDGEKLAERYFSPQESAYLNSVPDLEKARTFFRLWTLKEAYLKAMGLGFSGGLDSFSVQLTEGGGEAQLVGRHAEDRRARWQLKYFEACEGFLGALVAPGEIGEIRYFDGNGMEIKNAREGT